MRILIAGALALALLLAFLLGMNLCEALAFDNGQKWTFWTVTSLGQMERIPDAPVFHDKSACDRLASVARLSPQPDGRFVNVVCWPLNQ